MMISAGWRGNLALGLAAAGVASMPGWASSYHLQLGSTALIGAMFALSLQLLVGATGLVSLAHGAFFGLGAYGVYLLSQALGGAPSILLSLPASLLLAGVAAAGVGVLALRTQGFFFLMTTLAFGQMLFFLFHDTPLGGGMDGVFIQRPDLIWPVPRAWRPSVYLWLNLGVLVGMYGVLWWLMRTMFGHALLGIRANEHRMRAMGHDVQRLKLAAFTAAGALAGVAGHMAALTDAFVNPALLGWHRSAEALLMVLLGGIGALHGPILGAVALTVIHELGHLITERQRLVEGLAILLAVLLLRNGLAGSHLPGWRPSGSSPSGSSPSESSPSGSSPSGSGASRPRPSASGPSGSDR
jgi:branched-chain amino acid transport system permease protein